MIGVGINVGAQAVAGAASGVASLDEIDPAATPEATLARVAPALVDALRTFDAHGFPAFADRFAARDLLRGRAVVAASGELAGVAAGVSPEGALLVDTGAEVVAVTSGEWRIRFVERAGSPC